MAFPTTPTAAIQGTKEPYTEVSNRHRGCTAMTQEEIDTLWQQAMQDSVKDGEMFTRYHFAKLVAAKERERIKEENQRCYVERGQA